jgi:hypothetical protein
MANITTRISKWNIVLHGSKTYMNPLVPKRVIKISFFANIFSCVYQIDFPTCKTLQLQVLMFNLFEYFQVCSNVDIIQNEN